MMKQKYVQALNTFSVQARTRYLYVGAAKRQGNATDASRTKANYAHPEENT